MSKRPPRPRRTRRSTRPLSDAHRATIAPALDIGRIAAGVLKPLEFRVPVRRPDDFLVFDLVFDNLRLAPNAPPRLVRIEPGKRALIIVEFPPQSFGEQAFLEVAPEVSEPQSGETIPPLPSARVRMAGPSRIVVVMPDTETELPYALPDVLRALRTWPMRLDLLAVPDPPQREIRFDKGWLQEATSAAGWQAATEIFAAALRQAGGPQLDAAVEAAAYRLGDTAATALASGGGRPATALAQAMQRELTALAREFPALREGELRDAAIATMSLEATRALASNGLDFSFDLEAVARVPFLPIVLSPHAPPPNVTALELPYRVMLTPLAASRWLHADEPVERGERTELWHTRLRTAPTDRGPDGEGKVRAIWSPDYPIDDFTQIADDAAPLPFRMSLNALDRQMLVKLTAGFNQKTPTAKVYQPLAARDKRLHLSALGALLDVEGFWGIRPDGVDLEQWRHLAALARDHYVRVVYVGFLCPLGHRAALVKVTERKFETIGTGAGRRRAAALRQRYFLVPRERVKTFPAGVHEFGGNNFPFTQIEILTRVTPNLAAPGSGKSKVTPVTGKPILGTVVVNGQNVSITNRMAFWPMVAADHDVRFDVAVTDIAGRRVTFSMPLMFVSEIVNHHRTDALKAAYNAEQAFRRRGSLAGATVCYAPFTPADKGDPRLPTETMTFAAGNMRAGVHYPLDPNFHPETETAMVGIRAVQRMLAQPGAISEVAYPTVYKQHRFGESDPSKNPGQVFLALRQVRHLHFGDGANQAKSDTLGALAAPQMAIQGLSRVMGPVAATPPADESNAVQIEGALAKVIGNQFDPVDFFKGATILGGVDLSDLLAVVHTLTGGDVPKLLSREWPDRVDATYDWETEIHKSDPLGLFVPRADSSKPHTTLTMHALISAPLGAPDKATHQAEAVLTNFKVNLFGFVILWFEELTFRSKEGQKPDVAVTLREGDDAVQFGGPLEFVNELRNFIPSNGFSDPPSLAVTPSGIAASFSLTLPTLSVGIFSLSNASLGAGFNLPFDAKPCSVAFNFSTRQQPFSLTVSLLGGGGFFAIGVSARGVTEIEAALEFGAGVAIDLGVASGHVEIKAGVYFHWLEPEPDKGSIELAGYVRLHGELSVLGLISASLTFNLQLAYLKAGGKSVVWGEATLTIEVEVLFFSASVSVKCRREFGGSKSDPKFIDLVPDAATWTRYCEAFAEEAA